MITNICGDHINVQRSPHNAFQLWGHLYSAVSWLNFLHLLLTSHCSVTAWLTSSVQQQHLQMSKTSQFHFSLMQESSLNKNTALNSNQVQSQCFCGTIKHVFFLLSFPEPRYIDYYNQT